MSTPASPTTPRSRSQLSRDQRVQIYTLRGLGFTHLAIGNQLGITKRRQEVELEEFVTSSSEARQMSHLELAAKFSHWNCSQIAIKSALERRGFKRCIAQAKPTLTPAHMRKRLEWAEENSSWTPEQWSQIVWSDETWVTGERHTRVWVSTKPEETYYHTCLVRKGPRKRGWMLWGSFYGNQKRALPSSGVGIGEL
ncbi:hypothetical protein K3495_g3002 [Podosphaera aphanis]|nr:hypothetical protein K3495_g3002 [Podosphaera aphanis]